MPAAVKLREDFSAGELRALARRSKDVNQSRRLLWLAAVRDGKDRGEPLRQSTVLLECEKAPGQLDHAAPHPRISSAPNLFHAVSGRFHLVTR